MSLTTSRPPSSAHVGQPSPRPVRWPLWAALIALGALLYYAPAFFRADHDPTRANLLTVPTGWTAFAPDGTFLSTWAESGQRLRQGDVPLWEARTAQPLLEATAVPTLYPGAALYYLGGQWGSLLFSLGHFWLLGLALVWLCQNLISNISAAFSSRPRRLGLWAIALGGLALAGLARPDWLAAFAWAAFALALVGWRRRRLALIALPWPLGWLALAGPLPLTLALYAFVLVGWLLLNRFLALSPPSSSFKTQLLLVALTLVGGAFLAGPQLFPRLIYAGPPYDPQAAPFSFSEASATGARVQSVTTGADGELLLKLEVAARAEQVETVLKGYPNSASAGQEGPTGWGGQLFQGDGTGGKKGPEVKVSGLSARGDQRILVKFEAANRPATPGDYTLRLRYNPLFFNLGLYAVFLVLASQGLLLATLGWGRFYREGPTDHPLRRVVKNSATPLFAQLSGKIIDFGFAIFVLRLLGPEGNGEFTFAVLTWVFFATICDFGLEGIVTREVARARQGGEAEAEAQINRLFATKLFLRLSFSVAALPLSLLWIGFFGLVGNMTPATAWAIVLFMIGFWPSAVAGSITAVFRGYEKFEYLAAGQMLYSIIRVPLGLSALLLGWGVVGLAASALAVNFIQVAVLTRLMRRYLFVPRLNRQAWDSSLARQLLRQAYPLLLNGLTIALLFKSDGLLLGALRGNSELGLYNSAYKFIDALLIIPSTLTMALFPLFSAYGAEAKTNLLRAYREGLRLLLVIALPISVGTFFVAPDLIGFIGGAEYLPGGAIALQILIFFLPFSYINGVTQYVLIAIDKQKSITPAVVGAAAVNIGLNLLLIPFFGYVASAALTIVTELVMLGPFCLILRRTLGPGAVPLWAVTWRPALAAGGMGLALAGLRGLGLGPFVLIVSVGGVVYLAGLVLTGAITRQDVSLLKKVIKR